MVRPVMRASTVARGYRRIRRAAAPPSAASISIMASSMYSLRVGMLDGTVDTGAIALTVCTGSPAGVVTVAVLMSPPLASVNVPFNRKVILPPSGNVVSAIPAPCKLASVTVPAAGHAAPLVAFVQTIAAAVKPATTGSVNTLPLALPPLLVTVIVNDRGSPGFRTGALAVFVIPSLIAATRVLVPVQVTAAFGIVIVLFVTVSGLPLAVHASDLV